MNNQNSQDSQNSHNRQDSQNSSKIVEAHTQLIPLTQDCVIDHFSGLIQLVVSANASLIGYVFSVTTIHSFFYSFTDLELT
jgi:hypothetical protein